MTESVRNLKTLQDPLYITANTTIGGLALNTIRTNIDGAVSAGGSSGDQMGWQGYNVSRSGTSTLTIQGTFWHQTRYDLAGLYKEGKCLIPLGSTVQKSEPFSMGPRNSDNNQYVRDYTLWTTEPLTNTDLDRLRGLSSAPPYFETDADPATMNPSQVVSGQVSTHIAKTDIPPILGFLVPIHESALGFGDTVASPYLYCTRVVFVYNHTSSVAFWVDIPSSACIMSVIEDEPDDLLFLTKAVKSLDPPHDNSSP
jgi:hypothetical protein